MKWRIIETKWYYFPQKKPLAQNPIPLSESMLKTDWEKIGKNLQPREDLKPAKRVENANA